jgi:RecB family endonuclease NucS
MLERDLQDYLFSHPEVLFPGLQVTEKQREYSIDGKRIDLLFQIG